MKKVNYLVLLIVVAFMFSGCAVNKAPFQDYPAVTEVLFYTTLIVNYYE